MSFSFLSQPRSFTRHIAMAAAVSAVLVGCAELPAPSLPLQARNPEQLASERALAAPATTWPDDRWWQHYGDPQLDALIQEGLATAPDMAIAAARLRVAEASRQVAGAPLLPQVSANGSATE